MADINLPMTMHTLNKYGVPCIDVTEYADGGWVAGERTISQSPFFLQKEKYQYLVKTKLMPLMIPIDPITGIPWTFCYFYNDKAEWGGKGYCDYYSLQSGGLIRTNELPYQIGGPFLLPNVDIYTDRVTYNPTEYDGDFDKFAWFQRQPNGDLVMMGRVYATIPLEKDDLTYVGVTEGSQAVTSFSSNNVSVSANTMTISREVYSFGSRVRFTSTGDMPEPLVSGARYYLINISDTGRVFQLSESENGDPIDLTSSGTGTITMTWEDSGYRGFDNSLLQYALTDIWASSIRNNHIYANSYGDNLQSGWIYEEALPDLSPEGLYKRVALSKFSLFVGELAPGPGVTIDVEFGTLLPSGIPNPELYTFKVPVFDHNFDDGSGRYTIGNGEISGIFCYGQLFIKIYLGSYFEKWYNSSGTHLFDWERPNYTYENVGYWAALSPRVYHHNSFFHIATNTHINKSYLLQYNMHTGERISTELNNPYKDAEGYYQLTNKQIIGDQYIMVHLSDAIGHHVFFDVYSSPSTIKGEVTLEKNYNEVGFYVIPLIGDDQPASLVTNKLLQLCNNVRALKMTWAVNQVAVCQAHADWCTLHGVAQHEGPVSGMDGSASLRYRNDLHGIHAGVSENITIVMASVSSDSEQTHAFTNWLESPHHAAGIARGGNRYMSWACSLYPESVTRITMGPGMWDGSSYTTEVTYRDVTDYERGKLKLYVQNFIWY